MKHKITVHTSNTQIKIKEKNSTINPQRKKSQTNPNKSVNPKLLSFLYSFQKSDDCLQRYLKINKNSQT